MRVCPALISLVPNPVITVIEREREREKRAQWWMEALIYVEVISVILDDKIRVG